MIGYRRNLEDEALPARKNEERTDPLMATQTGFIPHGKNVVTLQVTSYHERCLKGAVSSALLENKLTFRSTMELLSQIECMMDQANFPQRNEESRAFRPAAQPAEAEGRTAAEETAPVIACFHLNTMFRQNATWQGCLFWADLGMEANFRSVLELLKLMDNALSGAEETS